MMTLPNFLSLLRIPLAFVFLQENTYLRAAAIILAMLTDYLDGYLARRYNMCSRVGTTLDPMTDKFFVFFTLVIFIQEGRIELWQAVSMLCRDFAVITFGLYLVIARQWDNYQFRAIWCGKIATTLQLFVLLALTFNFAIPSIFYLCFYPLGLLALIELYFFERLKRSSL